MKRNLAFVMALIMAFALIPGMALADKGSGGQQGGNYLDQSRWNGNIKVVYDTFTVSGNTKTGNNGAGVTAVTLNSTAVTWQNSNTKGGANGTALSSYYSSASNRNEQRAELAITAAEGYYVSRIVVACIDPGAKSPYDCETWRARNAYDVDFSLANSVKQTDGTFKLSTQLNSKYFCHRSNGSNHGYYILVQVAPIPKPVYVEYDYGNVLTLCNDDSTLATSLESSTWWTTVGSGNVYGSVDGTGNFVPNTKFAYNYSNTSDINNWKHTTNSVTDDMKTAVAKWNVTFDGWKVTYYADCTRNGDVLTFSDSDEVGTSSTIGEGKNLPVYTHAKLVAQWKKDTTPQKASLTVIKEVKGLEEGFELPADYEVTVTVGNQTITLKKGELSKTIQLDAGTYTVTETKTSDIEGYNLEKTEYSNLEANNGITLAAGEEATVTVTNTYAKKQEKASLIISKAVEGADIPKGYEVTVTVNDAEYKLNEDNQFRLDIEVAPGKYTIKEKSCTAIDGYYCESTTMNDQTTQETKIELANMAEAEVKITNKYAEQKHQNATLTITKSFRGVYAYDLPRSFTVYVRPMNEDQKSLGSATAVMLTRNSDNTYSATIELGYNVYEVTEQSPYLSGYVFTGANYSAESTGVNVADYNNLPKTNGIYVSTSEGEPASVAITNSYYYNYVPVTPVEPLPPQTGDSGTAYMGIALCVMAAAAFVAARSRKHS